MQDISVGIQSKKALDIIIEKLPEIWQFVVAAVFAPRHTTINDINCRHLTRY